VCSFRALTVDADRQGFLFLPPGVDPHCPRARHGRKLNLVGKHDDTTLAILAGGTTAARPDESVVDLLIDSRALLGWLLNRMAWTGPTMLVTSPDHERPPGHEQFRNVAIDPTAGVGPLRGVLTALEASTTPRVVIAAGNMPGVGHAQLDWLLDAFDQRDDLDLLMCSRLVNGRVQPEPFPLACTTKIGGAVAEQLAAGDASAQSLPSLPRASLVLAPRDWGDVVWTKLNSRADADVFAASMAPRE
jgi:molybdopterin-guanine dinucleotide biosynthesis protein A